MLIMQLTSVPSSHGPASNDFLSKMSNKSCKSFCVTSCIILFIVAATATMHLFRNVRTKCFLFLLSSLFAIFFPSNNVWMLSCCCCIFFCVLFVIAVILYFFLANMFFFCLNNTFKTNTHTYMGATTQKRTRHKPLSLSN